MVENIVIEQNLTKGDIEAGAEYLKALRRLKFEPEVMCWTFVGDQSFEPDMGETPAELRKDLAIVSSLVDYAGPKAMYDLLFKAYDASLLPRQIDPFSVSLYSPLTAGGRLLMEQVTSRLVQERVAAALRENPAASTITQVAFELPSLASLLIVLDGVYVTRKPAASAKSELKYNIFKAEVNRRAA